MTKNADLGPNLAVFGPKILIFMGVSKSFGTNITVAVSRFSREELSFPCASLLLFAAHSSQSTNMTLTSLISTLVQGVGDILLHNGVSEEIIERSREQLETLTQLSSCSIELCVGSLWLKVFDAALPADGFPEAPWLVAIELRVF